MNTVGTVIASALLVGLIAVPVYAQQPGASRDEHHPEAQAGSSTTPAPAPAPGMKGGAMPMMDMCRQMMSDMLGPPMIGGAAVTDPKERAEMLEMRGEMMKAMGDIMMKHARRMQGMRAR